MAKEAGPVVVRCDIPGCGWDGAVSYVVTREGKTFEVDLCPVLHTHLIDSVIELAGREIVRKKGGTIDSYA